MCMCTWRHARGWLELDEGLRAKQASSMHACMHGLLQCTLPAASGRAAQRLQAIHRMYYIFMHMRIHIHIHMRLEH